VAVPTIYIYYVARYVLVGRREEKPKKKKTEKKRKRKRGKETI
jgi:hypothetical protein